MLEIRKNTFSRSYENSFFREFSRHLYKSFKDKNLTGVLFGSPKCIVDGRLQIDALLITPNVVCIIDFKNFGGKITLPDEKNFENGLWKNETGEQIKGGSFINPFMQLKNQKRRFIDVYNKKIQSEIKHPNVFNPLHIVRVVCFQEKIDLIGKIPSIESLNFFILNKANFIEGICDIIDVTDKEIFLNIESYNSFKKIFRANKYNYDDNPFEDKLKDIASISTKHDYSTLYDDQKKALTLIKSFLEDPEQRIFILQGTTNSGKSHIIPFIQEIAYDTNIQETEIFAASGRIAKNLLASGNLENVNSIYSYIYGGKSIEPDEDEELSDDLQNESEEQEISDRLQIEIVPLKKCDNTEDALFIIDESQLVSDSYYESSDLIFGSGHLLSDFISFADLQNTKRKILFIGDPFQLHSGKIEDSSLNTLFFVEKYKLESNCFQLSDKPEFSELNKEALVCVKSIRSNYFNSLKFSPGNHFVILKDIDILSYTQNVLSNNIDFHYLCFTNEESQKINNWIKKTIINSGEDIAKGDLVLFNNNIQVEDETDPFSEPKKIYNGQFAIVQTVSSDIISETRKIKKEIVTLNFRELTVKLTESGNVVRILSLENYRLNSKGELSKNELIVFNQLLNIEKSKLEKVNPFIDSQEFKEINQEKIYKKFEFQDNKFVEQLIKGTSRKKDLTEEERQLKALILIGKNKYKYRIKIKLSNDPSSGYYKLRNAAKLRFGWAMTVHKSMSYKWDEVIFNVDKGDNAGKTNESYFNWLYTGITRARKKVNLINFNRITPFDKTILSDNNTGIKPAEFIFISENSEPEKRLEELKEFVDSKLLLSHIIIDNVNHLNYEERFSLCKNDIKSEITIGYDGRGRFKYPKHISGDKEISLATIELLKIKSKKFDFTVIKDIWRKDEYEHLSKKLITIDIFIGSIIQTNYKDKIRLFENETELDIEVDFTGEGAFSKITAKYYTNVNIWEKFIKVIENLKSKTFNDDQ